MRAECDLQEGLKNHFKNYYKKAKLSVMILFSTLPSCIH